MGTHDFKYNNVPLFARKLGNIHTSMFAAPKLALVPASRYYCDVTWSYHNACARVSSWMENPYEKSIWIFFSKILFFLICFNTYEL